MIGGLYNFWRILLKECAFTSKKRYYAFRKEWLMDVTDFTILSFHINKLMANIYEKPDLLKYGNKPNIRSLLIDKMLSLVQLTNQ